LALQAMIVLHTLLHQWVATSDS